MRFVRWLLLLVAFAALTYSISQIPIRWFVRLPLFVGGFALGTFLLSRRREETTRRWKPLLLAAASLLFWSMLANLILRYLSRSAWPYFAMAPGYYGRLWEHRLWLLPHIIGGMTALLIGPLQLWPLVRRRALVVHRWLGRVYVVAILLAAGSAFHLARHIPPEEGAGPTGFAMGALAVAWLVAIGFGVAAIWRRRLGPHRAWMLRSYAITLAFVSIRWLADLPWLLRLGPPEVIIPAIIWMSWLVPLAALEIFLRWPATPPPAPAPLPVS